VVSAFQVAVPTASFHCSPVICAGVPPAVTETGMNVNAINNAVKILISLRFIVLSPFLLMSVLENSLNQ
jgi:hypothetical protein